MSDKSDTPLTDAVLVTRHEIEDHGLEYTVADEFVDAPFARSLERQLSALSAELAALKHDMSNLYDSLNGEANARIALEAKLAAAREFVEEMPYPYLSDEVHHHEWLAWYEKVTAAMKRSGEEGKA